jgi:TIR domain
MNERFDVFLSYSSTDEAWVRRLAEDLKRCGVRVWLDRDEIRPGDLFAGGAAAS